MKKIESPHASRCICQQTRIPKRPKEILSQPVSVPSLQSDCAQIMTSQQNKHISTPDIDFTSTSVYSGSNVLQKSMLAVTTESKEMPVPFKKSTSQFLHVTQPQRCANRYTVAQQSATEEGCLGPTRTTPSSLNSFGQSFSDVTNSVIPSVIGQHQLKDLGTDMCTVYTPRNDSETSVAVSLSSISSPFRRRGDKHRTPMEVESRVISSRIIEETLMGTVPRDIERREEIQVIEEIERRIPTKAIMEVQRTVVKPVAPKQKTDIVNRTEVHYVNKYVQVPNFEETVRKVPVRKVIDIPREVIKVVPRKEVRQIVQEVDVPGDIIEIVQKAPVDREENIPKYIDKQVPLIVSQTHQPRISETGRKVIPVEVRQLNPKLIPVDVYIPKPVVRPLIAKQRRDYHCNVQIPAAQLNSFIKKLNPHLLKRDADRQYLEELYVREAPMNSIPFVPEPQLVQLIHPLPNLIRKTSSDPEVVQTAIVTNDRRQIYRSTTARMG